MNGTELKKLSDLLLPLPRPGFFRDPLNVNKDLNATELRTLADLLYQLSRLIALGELPDLLYSCQDSFP